jgi:hypothetical protein
MREGAWRGVVLLALLAFSGIAWAARHTKFYDVLGVPPDADDNVIKKAYRKQAL